MRDGKVVTFRSLRLRCTESSLFAEGRTPRGASSVRRREWDGRFSRRSGEIRHDGGAIVSMFITPKPNTIMDVGRLGP